MSVIDKIARNGFIVALAEKKGAQVRALVIVHLLGQVDGGLEPARAAERSVHAPMYGICEQNSGRGF